MRPSFHKAVKRQNKVKIERAASLIKKERKAAEGSVEAG
jgi:hypothetical protein